MSFVTQDDVWAPWSRSARRVRGICRRQAGDRKFRRIPYDEAIRKYGTDKPDLRNPIEMQAVTEHFAGSGFKVFAGMIASDPKVEVWAIPAKGGGSRAFCDRMNSWAQGEGQPGLGYIFWRKEEDAIEGAGPIAKNIGPERTDAIRSQMGLDDGDACFFVAGRPEKFASFRRRCPRQGRGRARPDRRGPLRAVLDRRFPVLRVGRGRQEGRLLAQPVLHAPGRMEALESQDPLTIKAYQYDLVCNGFEIASGGIRNHKPETMVKAFEIAGLSKDIVEERFGGLYRAFQYGAPPHGGMAAGVDRIVMLLCGTRNLREITLFPMNQQAADLLMGAPSEAEPKQLRELHVRLSLPKE
jgi:aspartyl-tRNA synthetase